MSFPFLPDSLVLDIPPHKMMDLTDKDDIEQLEASKWKCSPLLRGYRCRVRCAIETRYARVMRYWQHAHFSHGGRAATHCEQTRPDSVRKLEVFDLTH